MKYLLLLLVLVIAYAWWRNTRIEDKRNRAAPPSPSPPPAPGSPNEMVQCPVCSVHLPRGDAVRGADGRLFCSQEHQRLGGG